KRLVTVDEHLVDYRTVPESDDPKMWLANREKQIDYLFKAYVQCIEAPRLLKDHLYEEIAKRLWDILGEYARLYYSTKKPTFIRISQLLNLGSLQTLLYQIGLTSTSPDFRSPHLATDLGKLYNKDFLAIRPSPFHNAEQLFRGLSTL